MTQGAGVLIWACPRFLLFGALERLICPRFLLLGEICMYNGYASYAPKSLANSTDRISGSPGFRHLSMLNNGQRARGRYPQACSMACNCVTREKGLEHFALSKTWPKRAGARIHLVQRAFWSRVACPLPQLPLNKPKLCGQRRRHTKQ